MPTGRASLAAGEDAAFWQRQNSRSANHDLPHMTSTPACPSHPQVELVIATSAGKPLFHFVYDSSHPAHPNFHPRSALFRPAAAIPPLSAALTAFLGVTHGRVSNIATSTGTLVALPQDPFHLAVLARHHPAPLSQLRALLRVAHATLLSSMSIEFSYHLKQRPNARPSLDSATPLLRAALLAAITHPLSHALSRVPALPSPTFPAARAEVSILLRAALRTTESTRNNFSHALLFTNGPPHPSRLISSVAPANEELSSVDILLLSVLPHPPLTSTALYPHALGFARRRTVFSASVDLRVHADLHDAFKKAVGGSNWRPEWAAQASAHSLRLVLLGNADADPNPVVDALRSVLAQGRANYDVLVAMERPFSLNTFGVSAARAIVVLARKNRLAATTGALDYEPAVAMLTAYALARTERKPAPLGHVDAMVRGDGRGAKVVNVEEWDYRVVVWKEEFLIVFDAIVVNDIEAVRLVRNGFVPRLERCAAALIPEKERISVQPATPLAGFLAPFYS